MIRLLFFKKGYWFSYKLIDLTEGVSALLKGYWPFYKIIILKKGSLFSYRVIDLTEGVLAPSSIGPFYKALKFNKRLLELRDHYWPSDNPDQTDRYLP